MKPDGLLLLIYVAGGSILVLLSLFGYVMYKILKTIINTFQNEEWHE